ncbi:MAG: hypothetical protein KBF73_05385 [Flavobacteriales bacterium]|nr:hypothetical protein [Flavobacteriales bacterium]
MKNKQVVKILFGEREVEDFETNHKPLSELEESVQTFEFSSEMELNAFILGMKTAQGWEKFIRVDAQGKI